MRVHVLAAEPSSAGLTAAMTLAGHDVSADEVPGSSVPDAVGLGHVLAERWGARSPDAVVASGWLSGLAAQIAARGAAVPVVQRLFSPGRSRDPQRRRLEGAVARGAARNLALSPDDVERLVAFGVRRTLIRAVPQGVDLDVFRDEGPTWPPGPQPRLVAWATSADAVQDLTALLPALPRAELVLLAPPDATAEAATAAALDQAAARRPFAHRVRLVSTRTGELRRTLPPLLRSADLLLATGDDEPELCLALQAMACGVPTVARAVGALGHLVADGVTGLLAPSHPRDALGDAARALLGDDLRRESLGLAAGDHARASFGWAAVGRSTGRVLDELSPAPSPATTSSR